MDSTIYDIAKAAKVSVYTAMRALNGTTKGMRRDALERAERIHAVARSMNYRPNDAARSLATRKTGNLGFILAQEVEDGIGNQYYANLLSGVEQVCRKNGFGLHFGIGAMLEIEDFVYPKAVAGRSVDGLFLAGSVITPAVIEKFEKIDIPCLCFSHCEIDSEKLVRVHRDTSGFKPMLELCRDHGHRRIGIVELPGGSTLRRRLELQPWMAERNLEYVSLPYQTALAEDVAERTLDGYFSLPPEQRPTVIVTFPHAAMAMIDKLEQRGLKCPDDLSFICWGTEGSTRYFRPRLVCLDFATRDFGAQAAEAMVDHLLHGTPLHKMDIVPEITVVAGDSLKNLNPDRE